MPPNWPETTKELSAQLKNVRSGVPEVVKAFSAVAQAALAPKALDTKTKELIALAISVAIRCDDCIAFHAKAAVDQGASRDEVLETLGLAIYMGAGPSVMYASHASRRPRNSRRSGRASKGDGTSPRRGLREWPHAPNACAWLVLARAGVCAWLARWPFPFRVDTRGGRSHKHGPRSLRCGASGFCRRCVIRGSVPSGKGGGL